MADPLTWPAVVMGGFTIVNGSVLLPVVRAWKRNRRAGQQRDERQAVETAKREAALDALGLRTELAMREFGTQLGTLSQAAWASSGRSDVLDTRVSALERELEYVRRKFETLEARR